MPSKIITEEQEKDIISYYATRPMTLTVLGDKFDLSNPTIIKILDKHHIERYKKAQVYSPDMDESYFSNINTQEKAYFLGLIIADGNVFETKDGRQSSISITLQDGDAYILEKFKEETRTNNSVVADGRGASMIAVRSNQMADDLKRYGIKPRKSLETYLPEIPDYLCSHMIRGILDGDGCIQAKQTDIRGRYKHSLGFCGTELLMNQIKDKLIDSVGVTNVSVYTYKNRPLSMVTWGSVDDIRLLYSYLYDGATIFLTRKKEKIDSILKHYS